MNLILWRHAEAEDSVPDLDRRLTPRGRDQAQAMAQWLHAHLPERSLVLSSPALRARETAEALGVQYRIERDLAPDSDAARYLAVADWPEGRQKTGSTLVIVGHQPILGRVASLLMTGQELDWSVRKGAIWWFSARDRHARRQVVLRAVVGPETL